MTRLRNILVWAVATLWLAGCAAEVPTVEKRDAETILLPTDEQAAAPRPAEDRDLFYEGISFLSRVGKPDPAQARRAFVSFLQRHPQTRLRSVTESFIRLIDEGADLREAGQQERLQTERLKAERVRLQQENDQLKKTVRELTEKLRTETSSLSQENEQLRKDLQRLKALEIELEKRDRMLR
jgi:hypothetical protein